MEGRFSLAHSRESTVMGHEADGHVHWLSGDREMGPGSVSSLLFLQSGPQTMDSVTHMEGVPHVLL